jgi:hypothetical protein
MHAPTSNGPSSRSVLMRLLVRSHEYRHPHGWAGFRAVCGVWNLGLGIVLLAYGYWIGLVPLLGSALIFWTAYRLQAAASS